MKKQGMLKAKDDLAEARKAFTEMLKVKNLEEAECAWIRFVEKFARFFNKIAAAANLMQLLVEIRYVADRN